MPDLGDVQLMISQLPCEIQLPGDWADFFDKRGSVPTTWNDLRSFPRFHCRAAAALKFRDAFPIFEGSTGQWRVLIKDISRVSVAFLHSEQIFPKEVVALTLFDGTERLIEITRCRRMQQRCFEIGARFISTD